MMNQRFRDDLLRIFEREIGAPPQGVRQRVLAGVGNAAPRPSRRWQAAAGFVALLLAAAIVATLLVARENQWAIPGHKQSGVIPWLPLPAQLMAPVIPSPSPSPLPPGTPPCTSAQLLVEALGTGGATGHVFTSFGFAGRGPGACFLDGTPNVTLYDRYERPLPFQQRSFFGPVYSGPVLVTPGRLPEVNAPLKVGQAGFAIDWVSQPEQCLGTAGVQVAGARITLPGGGPAVTVNVPALTGPFPRPPGFSSVPEGYPCQGVGVSAFTGPTPPDVPATVLPLPAISLEVPAGVRAGDVLDYQVTLTNNKPNPMDLVANCPSYGEVLLPTNAAGTQPVAGIKPLYQLNCKPAGTLQPSASLTFEMRLSVPRDTTPGSYSVFFTLGYWNTMTKPISAALTVSG